MNKIETSIKNKIENEFEPSYFELENESKFHSVPENSETHFRILIVSNKFKDMNRVKRSQAVYSLLKEELDGGLHALAQRLYTPEEWEKLKNSVDLSSPDCKGGSKKS